MHFILLLLLNSLLDDLRLLLLLPFLLLLLLFAHNKSTRKIERKLSFLQFSFPFTSLFSPFHVNVKEKVVGSL